MGEAEVEGTGLERRKAISKFPQKERERVKGENFACGLRGMVKVIGFGWGLCVCYVSDKKLYHWQQAMREFERIRLGVLCSTAEDSPEP